MRSECGQAGQRRPSRCTRGSEGRTGSDGLGGEHLGREVLVPDAELAVVLRHGVEAAVAGAVHLDHQVLVEVAVADAAQLVRRLADIDVVHVVRDVDCAVHVAQPRELHETGGTDAFQHAVDDHGLAGFAETGHDGVHFGVVLVLVVAADEDLVVRAERGLHDPPVAGQRDGVRAQNHDLVRQACPGGFAESGEVPVHGGFAAVDVQLLERDGLQPGQDGGEQLWGHVLALGAVGEDTEVAGPVALRRDLDLRRLQGAGLGRTRGHGGAPCVRGGWH